MRFVYQITPNLSRIKRDATRSKTDPGSLTQSYSYDVVRNLTLLIDPDGGRYTSTFDPLNRQSTHQSVAGGIATAQYDNGSRCTTIINGFKGKLIRTYDALNRVVTLVEYTGGGSPVATVVDSYDAGGCKTSQLRDGLLPTYTNDNAGRLTGQQAAGRWATFTYDNADNVLRKWQQGGLAMTQTFDAPNRIIALVQGASTTNFTYNNVGNLALEA